ncbi:MAG: SpoIIE family protein phosphatase [Bacteroidetes bacterium]|nr:SpoIIE family protein phosphatase [Bacteroidota bacterium]
MKFTIGRRIGLGFATLIVLTSIAFILTVFTLRDSKTKTEVVVDQVTPSVSALKELNLLLQRSHTNLSKWFYNKSFNDIDFRDELKNIISKEYPTKKEKLVTLSKSWSPEEQSQLKNIFSRIETLFKVYKNEIMEQLNSTESYEDANIYYLARLPYEDSEMSIKTIYKNLNTLIKQKQDHADKVIEQMFTSFNFLKRFVQLLGIALIIGGIFVALLTTKSITIPIIKLKNILQTMSLGIVPQEIIRSRNDEIGDMSTALNELVQSVKETTNFAKETGNGNFNAEFKPLSKDDTLGHALLLMRDNLAENERSLEQKVVERTEEVVRQKEEIEIKNTELENLYKQVTDSIHYAKRIQEAILPAQDYINDVLPNNFVYYVPKDIVSGDFYWVVKKQNIVYFAAVDCTGHGVPGAFMSLVGHNILKDIINNTNLSKPAEIMNALRDGVIKALHAENNQDTKDGMDMTMCCINFETLELQYAAAFNPLYIIRNNELKQYDANKFPIGKFLGEKQPFTNHVIQLQKGDQLYLFSDGYADQFGGPRGKKFMVGNFRKILLSISSLPINEQKNILHNTLVEWQGSQEQVDDVLVMGLKI